MRYRRLLILLSLLAAGYLLFQIYFPVLSRYHGLKIEEETNERTIRDLERRIQILNEEKRLLEEDPEYLEKTVRKELGLVKPGEIIYKFIEDAGSKATPEQIGAPTRPVESAVVQPSDPLLPAPEV